MPDLNEAMDLAVIEIGDEAKLFENSSLYKYLHGVCASEIENYQLSLEAADPENLGNLRTIQNDIKVRRLFFDWINEAITNAIQAAENLEVEESDD